MTICYPRLPLGPWRHVELLRGPYGCMPRWRWECLLQSCVLWASAPTSTEALPMLPPVSSPGVCGRDIFLASALGPLGQETPLLGLCLSGVILNSLSFFFFFLFWTY